jgi:protein-L-isoaspartate(D-aspartate) O-methyltransferase
MTAKSERRSALRKAAPLPLLLGCATLGVFLIAPIALAAPGQNRDPWAEARAQMVEHEVVAAGVKDARVCDAMRAIPRHEFISPSARRYAYLDIGIPIGEGQTISSPFTVAYMTEQLQPLPTDKVLEIGTGSGYQAAVLSRLVSKVYSIEIVESLGRRASQTLRRLGYKNVETKIGDGYQGWAEHAPFDKIIVTCSPEHVPKPLVEQLKEGGRLVVPLGERYQQTLYLFKKVNGVLKAEPLQPTFFVPMMGRAEGERVVHANPGEPILVDGDFKKLSGDQPVGWYYIRQGKVEAAGRTPHSPCLTFRNESPGRAAQAFQAVGIDGRWTEEIDLSSWFRGKDVQPGSLPEQQPSLSVVFFNTNRRPIARYALGPWSGTFDWVKKSRRIKVPASARLASVEVGLWGGTGELSVAEVAITVVASKRPPSKADAK